MNPTSFLVESASDARQMNRARVLKVGGDQPVLCAIEGEDGTLLDCELLHTSDQAPLCLDVGDTVLVWRAQPNDERGVVLGRLGKPKPIERAPKEIPEEIVLEAKSKLILRCGDGTITIREDGKILLRGKDLLSRAQRLNRIKGGSVAIN